MPEHLHSLSGNGRDLTIDDLKEFVEAATRNSATSKKPLHVETSGRKLRKIWIDLSTSS
ncbi:hypothetical protein ACFC4G_46515 [Streptomyces sp. NPDC056002]|uniref:hypothetical protein n=1 Tax=Streptomyces sp. NPDC056002 TaxID=3345675 RepID=UPI0035DDC003